MRDKLINTQYPENREYIFFSSIIIQSPKLTRQGQKGNPNKLFMIISFAIQANECLSICLSLVFPSGVFYHLLHISFCLIIAIFISQYFILFVTAVNRLFHSIILLYWLHTYIEKIMYVFIYKTFLNISFILCSFTEL